MSVVSALSPLIPTAPESHSEPQAEFARRCLYYMKMMREVEDRIERKLYRQGKIVGGVYVGRGPGGHSGGRRRCWPSRTTSCSRRIATWPLFLIRGVHPRQIFAQYMGRVGGLTRGSDGNMHMGDMKLNIVAIISAMAASVPVAAGAALAFKYKGTTQRRVLLLRRRRHQPRRLARRRQLRRRPEAARRVRLQQQPVRLLDAALEADGLRQRGRPRRRRTAFRPKSWMATTCSPCTKPPAAPPSMRAPAWART